MTDVNEMWRLREKELDLEKQMHQNHSCKYQKNMRSESLQKNMKDRYDSKCKVNTSSKEVRGYRNECSSSENAHSSEDSAHDCQMHSGPGDEGLCDEEIEAFLRSTSVPYVFLITALHLELIRMISGRLMQVLVDGME